MLVDLLPEFVGLILTPAAIAGCILLLQSHHPYPNAVAFAAAFLVVYAVISVLVLAIGDSVEPTDDTSTTKGVTSLVIGSFFLVTGTVVALHHQQTRTGPPKWATILEGARPTGAFIAGLVLAIANPNVFLLLSGLGIIVAESTSRGSQVGGTAFLLSGVALDFVVPVIAFAVLGSRARAGLDRAKQWMVTHDRILTLVILFGFGLLFAGRGLGSIL